MGRRDGRECRKGLEEGKSERSCWTVLLDDTLLIYVVMEVVLFLIVTFKTLIFHKVV